MIHSTVALPLISAELKIFLRELPCGQTLDGHLSVSTLMEPKGQPFGNFAWKTAEGLQ